MPLVRIDLRKGKHAGRQQAIGQAVYEAMIAVGVPANDRFQIIAEHDADHFLYDPSYLGIERTEDLIIIQITWNEGRTIEQKKALYQAIVDGLVTSIGIRPQDVFINLVEVKRENWSFGFGIAQLPPDMERVADASASAATEAAERRHARRVLVCTSAPSFILQLDAISSRSRSRPSLAF
jgi:phenylpyruvate tautomerase PptA (4-oxalocrotonate tautomerase family)